MPVPVFLLVHCDMSCSVSALVFDFLSFLEPALFGLWNGTSKELEET